MSNKNKSIEGVHLKAGMQIAKRTSQVKNEVKVTPKTNKPNNTKK
jgi:phosphotransferase system HPr-like phosphotransfer protein